MPVHILHWHATVRPSCGRTQLSLDQHGCKGERTDDVKCEFIAPSPPAISLYHTFYC